MDYFSLCHIIGNVPGANCHHQASPCLSPGLPPDVDNFTRLDLRWLALLHLEPLGLLVVVVVCQSVSLGWSCQPGEGTTVVLQIVP